MANKTVAIVQNGKVREATTSDTVILPNGEIIASSPTVTAIAQESISAGDLVFYKQGVLDQLGIDSSLTPVAFDATNNQKFGIRFVAPATLDISTITIYIRKNSSPSDSFRIGIQGSSAGLPDGTYLNSGNAKVDTLGSSLSSTLTRVTFTLGAVASLTSGTTYHVVLERTGTADATNTYAFGYFNGTTGTDTLGYAVAYNAYNGSAWSSKTNTFIAFGLNCDSLYALKADKTNLYTTHYDGIASAAASAGASVSIQDRSGGVITNASLSLTAGRQYYVGTSGTLSTTPSKLSVGTALSSTSIKVNPSYYLYSELSPGTNNNPTTLRLGKAPIRVESFINSRAAGLSSAGHAIGYASEVGGDAVYYGRAVGDASGTPDEISTTSAFYIYASNGTGGNGTTSLSQLTLTDWLIGKTTTSGAVTTSLQKFYY